MIRYFFLFSSLLLLGGCAISSKSDPKTEALHRSIKEVQMELAEVKYLVNNHQRELSILDEKIQEENQVISQVKTEALSGNNPTSKKLRQDIDLLKKQIANVDGQQEKIIENLKKLGSHAEKTTSALAQYKTKMEGVEKTAHEAKERLEEVRKLKGTLTTLTQTLSQRGEGRKIYRVQSGDSIGAIAQQYGTTSSAIKSANRLDGDNIIAGQELVIPSP